MIFPMIQPTTAAEVADLPLCREIKWDFAYDKPIFKKGNPVYIEGAEAVATWSWNALHTVRNRHEIYTGQFGNESEKLIGQNYTDELKQAEAARYVRECLLTNPYISEVSNIKVAFAGKTISVSCALTTVYGTITLER